MDLGQKKCLTIDSAEKTAELLPMYRIDDMQQDWNQAHKLLRTVDPNAKSIGESTVAGRPCEDFELRKTE